MRKPSSTLAVAGAVAVLAGAGLAVCSDGLGTDPDAVVRIAIAHPPYLVPTDADDPASLQVLSALFAPLVEVGGDGTVRGVAAESVHSQDGGRTWTVRLRDGFTFHDGEPVIATNYLAAWNYAAHAEHGQRTSHLFARIAGFDQVNPPGGWPPTARAMSGLTRIDDLTFTVTLTRPFGDFPATLTLPAFYPLPSSAFGPDGQLRPGFADEPVGNGPFRYRARDGDTVALERYDGFAGPPPRVGGVRFVPYQDATQAYADLVAGRVDLTSDIPADLLADARQQLNERYLRRPGASFQFLAFPAYRDDLADPRVRRAISMAIDRDHLADTDFGGRKVPARAFTAPVVPGARSDSCGSACQFAPEPARDLYQRAGGPPRLTITYNDDGGHAGWIEAVCEQLRTNLAVSCEASAEPALAGMLTRIDQHRDVGVFRLGWSMEYPSMESYLGPLFHTAGSSNWHGYANPEFDALLAAGDAAGSPAESVAAYRAAEDLLARDLPVVPLGFSVHHIGHAAHVRGVTMSVTGVDLTRIEVLR